MTFVVRIFAALLALVCGHAGAQSSLRIGGVVNLNVSRGNGGTSPLFGNGNSNAWMLNDVVSHIDIESNEDLGGGMSAGFSLQHFFTADSGAAAAPLPGPFWDGRSLVRLGGRWGQVYAGREYSPIFYTSVASDPWSWNTSAESIGNVTWANYLNTSLVRTNNTVGYVMPNLGGFSARVAWGMSEGTEPKDVGFNVEYAAGALWLGAAYDQHKSLDKLTMDRLAVLTGAYDLGSVRPVAMLASSRVGGRSYSAWSLALTMPWGVGALKVGYSGLSDADRAAAGKQALRKLSLGYRYNLSVRSSLTLGLGSAKAEGQTRSSVLTFGLAHSF